MDSVTLVIVEDHRANRYSACEEGLSPWHLPGSITSEGLVDSDASCVNYGLHALSGGGDVQQLYLYGTILLTDSVYIHTPVF